MPEPRADIPPPAETDRSIDDLLAEAASDIDGDFESVDAPLDAPMARSQPDPESPSEPEPEPEAADVDSALDNVASDLNALAIEANEPADVDDGGLEEPVAAQLAPSLPDEPPDIVAESPATDDEILGDMEAPASAPAPNVTMAANAETEPDLDAVLEQAAADLDDLPIGSLDAPGADAFSHVPSVNESSTNALLDADLQVAEIANASNLSLDDLPEGDFADAASTPAAPPPPAAKPAPVPVTAKPAAPAPTVVAPAETKKPKKEKKSKEPADKGDAGARRSPVTVVSSFVIGALVEMNAPVRQLSASTRDFVGIIALLTAFNAAAAWLVWLLLAGR